MLALYSKDEIQVGSWSTDWDDKNGIMDRKHSISRACKISGDLLVNAYFRLVYSYRLYRWASIVQSPLFPISVCKLWIALDICTLSIWFWFFIFYWTTKKEKDFPLVISFFKCKISLFFLLDWRNPSLELDGLVLLGAPLVSQIDVHVDEIVALFGAKWIFYADGHDRKEAFFSPQFLLAGQPRLRNCRLFY